MIAWHLVPTLRTFRNAIIRLCLTALAGGSCILASPVACQTRERLTPDDATSPLADTPVARTPEANAGKIGQRQTRADVVSGVGIDPMARIDSRIANRVQSRLRNRIDKYYDPQSNSTSPFLVAQEQTRGIRRR